MERLPAGGPDDPADHRAGVRRRHCSSSVSPRCSSSRGPRVIFECPEKLIKLISGLAGDRRPDPAGRAAARLRRLCSAADGPGPDRHLGRERSPPMCPTFMPTPKLVEKWRRELAGYREFKVGINWQGNPKYAGDCHRSIPLRVLRAAGARARRAALQPSEERRARAARRRSRASSR